MTKDKLTAEEVSAVEEKNLRQYAKLMKEMDLTALEINENGSIVRLERASSPVPAAERVITEETALPEEPAAKRSVQTENITEVVSPMVGVFYAAPSEQASPYVQVGDKVKRGDVLCIVEAMKLMNEILAEEAGTVVEVCAKNQQIVDFGHVLFRIRREQEAV